MDPTTVFLSGIPKGDPEEVLERAVRRAAEAATDFSWLSRGDNVLVKVACNSGNVYPFTTDLVALRAMVALLRERGAGRIIVADMSGVQFVRFSKDHLRGSTRALMTKNGMADTIAAAGAELHAFEERGWDAFHEEKPEMDGHWPAPVMMPDVLNEVDHIVLMPRCARHVLAGATLGLKAAVGWWRHDSRLDYHRGGASLPQKTAEANSVPTLSRKQRLVLSSATRIVTTFGPDNGWIVRPETGIVIASGDVVAHDMVSLAWLLEGRRATPARRMQGLLADPHRSQWIVGLINRMVAAMLGGPVQALRAEAPPSVEVESIWDDPTLSRAFEVFGGVPRVELEDASAAIPAPLLQTLEGATRAESGSVQPRS
jgi:uncharacterized protein (DUF362 family)